MVINRAETYTGTTTINAGVLQIGNGGTTGSLASQNVVDNSMLVFNHNDDISYGGNISGTGGLTKSGTNTLTLTGTNAFSGGTTISAGSLQVGNGGTTGSLAGNIVNNAKLVYDVSGTATVTGAVTGSGTTTIQAGTLQVGNGGTTGSLSGNVVNNGILVFNRSDNSSFTGTISGTGTIGNLGAGTLSLSQVGSVSNALTIGAGGINLNPLGSVSYGGIISGPGALSVSSGTVVLTNANTYAGGTVLSGGTLAISSESNLGNASGSLALNGGTLQTNASITITRNIVSNNATIDTNGNDVGLSSLSGSNLTKTGSGALSVTGIVSIPNISVSGGTLNLNGSGNVLAYITVSGGSALNVNNNSAFDGTISLGSGSITVSGTNASVSSSSGDLQIGLGGTGSMTVNNGASLVSGQIEIGYTLGSHASLTIASGATGTADFVSVASSGVPTTGTLTVTGAGSEFHTILDDYIIVGGFGAGMVAAADGGLISTQYTELNVGLGNGVGTVELDGTPGSRGMLSTGEIDGINSSKAKIIFNGGILQAKNDNGDFINTGASVTIQSGGAFIDTNGYSITIKGEAPISGAGGLTKLGAGTLTLSGNNSYSGGTILQDGKLVLGSNHALGSGALTTIDPTVAYANGVNIPNPIIMMADTDLEVDNADSATQTGTISESGGSYGITKIGTGTLKLNGLNAYTGATTINVGTLTIDPGGSIATSSSANLAGSSAVFDISGGGNQTIKDLIGVAGSTVNLGTNTLTSGTTNSTSFGGSIQGTGGLTKQGTGALTLSGSSTYSGGTHVTSGKLLVSNSSGSATGSGALTVDSGSMIGGTGTIASSNNAINGNVQVGTDGADTTSVLTMTATGTTTFSNANLVFNLSTTNLGQGNELDLGATSSVMFSNTTLTLNLQGLSIIPDTTEYILLTSSIAGLGAGGSIFSGISVDGSGVISGFNITFLNAPTLTYYENSYLKLVSNGTGYNINVEVVPEPTTWTLMLGGLALLIFGQCRRKLL